MQQTAQGSLGSVTEESQILPIPDGSGKYILKSSGFYCLNEDGTRENAPAVHYFDHFVIDGTVFDGYYYHDENGKFVAGNPHMVQIRNLTAPTEDGSGAEVSFDGCYMAVSYTHLDVYKRQFQSCNLLCVGSNLGIYFGNLFVQYFYFGTSLSITISLSHTSSTFSTSTLVRLCPI